MYNSEPFICGALESRVNYLERKSCLESSYVGAKELCSQVVQTTVGSESILSVHSATNPSLLAPSKVVCGITATQYLKFNQELIVWL